jgi:hypothetical protein
VELADAPILWMGPSLHEAGLLEAIHQRHHPAGRHPEALRQRLLRLAL